jgi:hypothetical protein
MLTFALMEGSLRLYHYSPVFIFPDNSENRFRGKPFVSNFGFTLNSRGFHDTEFQPEKLPGSIRIVTIGDSFVFGVVPGIDTANININLKAVLFVNSPIDPS